VIWSLCHTLDLLGRPVLRSEVEAERHLRKYDSVWLDGRTHTVWQGTDFQPAPPRFACYLHQMARDHGGRMSTSVSGDSITFRFMKESP
jgi:hypothetical protein